ncbi:unnamed protein product (macronuclear) [Paramecium tetraurelia]|uniref:Uncharacterized protein n=1 Tax=Paramecium tetraurelia TaxID=5888 RepID=A0CFD0_PARTE|nr:uncharacterized protein GSPATT00037936001 [Paramecium tetraurelia]CAK69497.1 unnamed protein product [Paramecium tetraurelia]|eukprot:XP_001436894.1 hypothetical protein (macronuclear) [Paramecium tetraurelia strain d4-2]
MQLSAKNHSNNYLENYPRLPLIPQKNQFLTQEKPQFRIYQQSHHQKNQLTFKEIFEINQKNQELLNELMYALSQDLPYQQQQILTNLNNQQDYDLKVKPDRIRYPSVDNRIQMGSSLEDVRKYPQVGMNQFKELQPYSRTERMYKKRNAHQRKLSDNGFEIDNKQNYKYKVINGKQNNTNQKIQKNTLGESKLNKSLIGEQNQNKKLKFKTVGYVVFATMCLSKKYRIIQQKKQFLRNQLNHNYQEHQKVVDQFSKRQAITHERQYYAYVVEKIIHHLKEQSFIDETLEIQNQSKEYQSDIRKVHIFKFTTLLLKNVELYTRQNTITDIVRSQINMCIYEQTGIPISRFVGQRCHFYNDDRVKIPVEQQVLIALEYYFFCNLIPQLCEIVADLQDNKTIGKQKVKTNPSHLNECHFYICVLATLIQQKIVQVFSELKKVKNPNGSIVQKSLKTTEQQNLVIKAYIAINTQLEDDNNEESEIVKGLISSDLILALEEEKPQWKKFIDKTFSQIITNLSNLLKK